jgi:hypothetical protein
MKLEAAVNSYDSRVMKFKAGLLIMRHDYKL